MIRYVRVITFFHDERYGFAGLLDAQNHQRRWTGERRVHFHWRSRRGTEVELRYEVPRPTFSLELPDIPYPERGDILVIQLELTEKGSRARFWTPQDLWESAREQALAARSNVKRIEPKDTSES
jgi:hypothetical protein